MKIMSKKTGKVVSVSERTWTALRDRGRGRDYQVVDAAAQPQVKDVFSSRGETIKIENLTQEQEKPTPKKKRKPRPKKVEDKIDVEPQIKEETNE